MTQQEYEELAIISIFNYLNDSFKYSKEYIKNNFNLQIKLLVENSKKLMELKVSGAKQLSQGDQSITFNDHIESFTISNDIKSLLPKPKKFHVW
ncbi:MAG: hypothetical protein ACRDD7_03200 [Peptostreptococcaceae bacterium]